MVIGSESRAETPGPHGLPVIRGRFSGFIRLGAVNVAGTEECPAFFHPHRTRMDLGFQASAAAHMNNPPAMDDPGKVSPHLKISGLHGKREASPGILFNEDRWGNDPAGADTTGRKVDLAFGPQHADNTALYVG